MDRTHRNQVRITVNMKNVPCVRSLASATIVRIRWSLTAMWVWAKVTGKYCILSPPHEGTVEDRIHHKR